MITPTSITTGDIYWLPKERDLPEHIQVSLGSINNGVFGHPVIVVAISKTRQTARCCTITSLGGQSFYDYHAGGRAIYRQNHIPISPAPCHPDTGVQLRIESGANKFDKVSYIKIGSDNMFSLPRLCLDCGCPLGENHRLASSSLDVLRQQMERQGCCICDHQVQEIAVSPPSSPTLSSRSPSPARDQHSGYTTTGNSSGVRYRRKSDGSATEAIMRKTSWRRSSDTSSSTKSESTSTSTSTTPAGQPKVADARDRPIIINAAPQPPRPRATTAPTMLTFSPISPLCRITCKC